MCRCKGDIRRKEEKVISCSFIIIFLQDCYLDVLVLILTQEEDDLHPGIFSHLDRPGFTDHGPGQGVPGGGEHRDDEGPGGVPLLAVVRPGLHHHGSPLRPHQD